MSAVRRVALESRISYHWHRPVRLYRARVTYWVNSIQLWDSTPGTQSILSAALAILDYCGAGAVFSLGRQDARTLGSQPANLYLFTGRSVPAIAYRTATPSPAPPTRSHSQHSRAAKSVLISGNLDNSLKLWDIDTGEATSTFIDHIEFVWAVAGDKSRLAGGSHDHTIKMQPRSYIQPRLVPVGDRLRIIGAHSNIRIEHTVPFRIQVYSFQILAQWGTLGGTSISDNQPVRVQNKCCEISTYEVVNTGILRHLGVYTHDPANPVIH
ncbi:hypothetical protein DFH09DRAFT_1077831 [Mycena vulgaris]|nr:hypothetical protein DFH09DRAFT_1077831 [Mycena vulgaris]